MAEKPKGKKRDIEKVLATASEKYSENTRMRTIVCGIPYVGGSLDVLFTSKGRKIVARRIESLFTSLKNEVSDITENTINKSYLDSEEFFDLVVHCINSAVKTRSKDKIILLSKIIKEAITTKDVTSITEEDLLYVIDDLNAKDLNFIKFLINHKPIVPETERAVSGYSAPYLYNIDSTKTIDYYLYHLTKLEKIGLLSLNIRVGTDWERFVYKPTTILDRIVEYLYSVS